MPSQPLDLDWAPADVDVADLWARSGGQSLTRPGSPVPTGLVSGVAGVIRYLDQHGAGLAELCAADGVGVLAERAATLHLPPASGVSCGAGTHLLEASDGWIAASLPRVDDVELIPAWLQIEASSLDSWHTVSSAAANLPAIEIVTRARLLGLACSVVGEAADRIDPVLVTPYGPAAPKAPVGIIVVNLAPLWAGPLCADVLRRVGARVIKVESMTRPDGSRLRPPFFEALHSGQESVALDFGNPRDLQRLEQLLARADVVIEGSRPRALAQLGIDMSELISVGPQVWISITAHGRAEPFAQWTGFGDDAAAAGGLVTGSPPSFIADAVADPITGLIAAAAAMQLLASGGRWLADVALSRAAASMSGGGQVPPLGDPAQPMMRRGGGRPFPLGGETESVFRDLFRI
jgi:hypothetical protein